MQDFKPVLSKNNLDMGKQDIYRFENGYGASLISRGCACGGLELAVIKFHSADNDDFDLDFETPITDDVIGYLKEEDIPELLERIAVLS